MKHCLMFTALLFFVFSCTGMPELDYEMPAPPQFVGTFEETFDYPVLEDIYIEPEPDEELPEEFLPEEFLMEEPLMEELPAEEIFENDPEPYYEPEEITETDMTEDTAAVESESLDQDEEILAVAEEEEAVSIPDTELVEIPQIVQAPTVQEPPSVPAPAQTPEVTQPPPAPPVTTPLPQPPIQAPPTQLPVQTQTPQERIPAQPPAPALLGPAEERPGTGREDSAGVGQRRDSIFGGREQPVTPSQSVIAPQNDDIVFSRIVRVTVGQTVEIPFRGTGWVYLGELASRRGIVYSSRRLDPEGQSFIFMAEEVGTYTLKFFKQDFIRDYILNDHVQVIVGEAPAAASGWFNSPVDRGRIVAQPRWPSAQDEAEILRGGSRPGANTPPVNIPEREAGAVSLPETVPSQDGAQDRRTTAASGTAPSQGTPPVSGASVPDTSVSGLPSTPPPVTELPSASAPPQPPSSIEQEIIPPGVLLQRAKETFDGGNVAAAIALLDQYAENYPSGTDELYWMYGQFYEANSPSRNILSSLDYYRRLTREYPQSSRYNDARRRIAYLERYYINIQ